MSLSYRSPAEEHKASSEPETSGISLMVCSQLLTGWRYFKGESEAECKTEAADYRRRKEVRLATMVAKQGWMGSLIRRTWRRR